MSNIEVKAGKSAIDLTVNDPALIRTYEKACGSLDSEKILHRIDAFLSRR